MVPPIGLPARRSVIMLPAMFVVTEADAAAIRAIFEREGELSAAIEVRRLFPGITDNVRARECARTIAGWKPLPAAACKITPLRPPPRAAPVNQNHDQTSRLATGLASHALTIGARLG
jgi:hypothetical protein